MQAMFDKYTSISVKHEGVDVTKTIIDGIVKHGFLDVSPNLTYFDDESGEELNKNELKYIVPWTILNKMNVDAMDESLEELRPNHREYVKDKRLREYKPDGQEVLRAGDFLSVNEYYGKRYNPPIIIELLSPVDKWGIASFETRVEYTDDIHKWDIKRAAEIAHGDSEFFGDILCGGYLEFGDDCLKFKRVTKNEDDERYIRKFENLYQTA